MHENDWTEYIDLSGQLLQAFKIESFPTYIVLDKDGVMRLPLDPGLEKAPQQNCQMPSKQALKAGRLIRIWPPSPQVQKKKKFLRQTTLTALEWMEWCRIRIAAGRSPPMLKPVPRSLASKAARSRSYLQE